MKTKVFLFTIVLCISYSLYAQTIHSIVFTDSNDDFIGVAARASHDNYSLDLLSTIETALGASYNSASPIEKSGYECNKTNLLQILDNLKCDENDIVVFIYIGHGARGLNDPSNFPQMCFSVPQGVVYRNENDYYPLENVRDIIMRKKPRFCLVIGDCCNSYSPTLSTKPSIDVVGAMAPDIIRKQGENIIKQLFLSKKGSVIITASVKGQYGWCFNGGDKAGMFMEQNINGVFQDIKDGKSSYSTWEELLSTIRNNTYQLSINVKPKKDGKIWTQTPYYEINLKNDAGEIKPKKKIEAQSIQQALSQVADSRSYSDTERLALSRTLMSKYFDGDKALVEVVGKDRKTIIQSTDIRKYLLRAATESDIANITIMEQHKDDKNKVTYLRVHEIYTEPAN